MQSVPYKTARILHNMAQKFQPILVPDARQNPDWIWIPGTRAYSLSPASAPNNSRGPDWRVNVGQHPINLFRDAGMCKWPRHWRNTLPLPLKMRGCMRKKNNNCTLQPYCSKLGHCLQPKHNQTLCINSFLNLLAEVVAYDSVTLQLLAPDEEFMTLAAGRGFTDMQRVSEIVRSLSVHSLTKIPSPPYWEVIPDTHLDPDGK